MKNRYFQSVCLKIDRVIPTTFTKYLYYPSYLVFALLCRMSFGKELNKTYLRNSFYLNYFTFGLSDYDFGIILHRRVNTSKWNKFFNRFKKIKRIFPFWSEINVYVLDELNLIAPFINPTEAMRDPFLVEKISKESSTEERFAFIIRCLFVNLKNWHFESKKKKKWKTYFELCQLEINHSPEIDFILSKSMSSFYKTEIQSNFPRFIKSFFELFEKSKDILWEPSTPEVKVLLPQFYLWFEREEGSEDFLKNLNPSDKNLLIAQLKWEVWGLTTQLYHFQNNPSFKIHLNRIKNVFIILDLSQDEVDSLSSILRIFDQLNQV